MADDVEQTLLQAVERFAVLLDEAGMPRMPARVFAYLLMEERDGFTAGELAEALRVSPAAISGAVRYLTQTRMIVRERMPGARRDHYRLHDDIWYESTLERVGLLRRWEQLLAETIELIGPSGPGAACSRPGPSWPSCRRPTPSSWSAGASASAPCSAPERAAVAAGTEPRRHRSSRGQPVGTGSRSG